MDGGVTKCFDLPGAASDDYFSLFEKMDSILSKDRHGNDSGQPWSTMTMIVDQTGALKVDYDYEDFSEEAFVYKARWRDRYLG